MEYKIIRGKNQIGGCITEISSGETRIWVDFGENLSKADGGESDRMITELMKNDPPQAVLFTHAHGDHTGLMSEISDSVKKIYIGPTAKKMMLNIRETLLNVIPDGDEKIRLKQEYDILKGSKLRTYKNEKAFKIGNIRVTPYRIDHSIYDAYMLRFEADGECIVHTGDFRGHGRLGEYLEPTLKKIADGVTINTLIIEGTMMSRNEKLPETEDELEEKALEKMIANPYAFLICSSTNIESLASFYAAAFRSREERQKLGYGQTRAKLYANSYYIKQFKLYADTVGKKEKDWRFFFSATEQICLGKNSKQFERMIENGFIMIIGTNDNSIEYYGELMEMFREYNPTVFYSMWNGYLDKNKEYGKPGLIALHEKWNDNWEELHTSGHADPKTIAKVIETLSPTDKIVPIHTENPKGFYELEISDENIRRLQM